MKPYNPLRNPYSFFSLYWWKHFLDLTNYYYGVKYFWQRGTRGWADCDTWSFDYYLLEVLPDALKYYKDHLHSWPGEQVVGAETPEEWDKRLQEMIDGFQVGIDYLEGKGDDHCYEPAFNKELYTLWSKPLLDKFNLAMKNFHTYFFALWD